MGIDVWLKRIWLIIGILVLLSIVMTGVVLLYQLFTSPPHRTGVLAGIGAQPKGPDSLITQDLSYDQPRPVGRTDFIFIGVRIKELSSAIKAPPGLQASSDMSFYGSSFSIHHKVNIIFTKRNGLGSYLLLDKKAFIQAADIPSPKDSLQNFNLYDIAFYDTNHDGRINESNSSQLFISDITGHNLFPITQSGEIVRWYQKSNDCKKLYILLQDKPKGSNVSSEDWPERLYIYDVESRTLSRFPTGEDINNRIRKILWEK